MVNDYGMKIKGGSRNVPLCLSTMPLIGSMASNSPGILDLGISGPIISFKN
jgi:hypothetical protein